MRSQIEQLDSQLSSTSDQITSMIDMFNREKDKLQLKITLTRKKLDNKQMYNRALNPTTI